MSNDNNANNTESVKFLTKITPYDKDGEAGKIKFILGDKREVILDISKVSQENQPRAMVHGLAQKIGDAISGLSKEKRYGDAYELITKNVELMYSPNWTFPREGFERGVSEEAKHDLAFAIAKLKKVPFEQAAAAVQKAENAQLKEWLKVPAIDRIVAEQVAKRKAEAAKNATVDIDSMDFGL